jgi:PAS domain S-box-containing protein
MAVVAPDGRWQQVNAALCELVGFSEHELLGGTFQAITHPADLDADVEFVRHLSWSPIGRRRTATYGTIDGVRSS